MMNKRSAVVAAAAVAVTAALLLWRRRAREHGGSYVVAKRDGKHATHTAAPGEDVDELFAAPLPTPAAVVPPAATTTTTTAAAPAAASLLDEALQELEREQATTATSTTTKAVTTSPPPATTSAAVTPPPAASAPALTGKEVALDRLGVTLRLPDAWEANREFAPSPNIVIVSISNPAWGDATTASVGEVPIIALTAEDVHGENLTLSEFNERSKEVSVQQLLMLTYGTIQPVVRRDEDVSVGPFRHMLEYVQSTPPLFNMCVTSLSTMRNGVAYVLQMTSNMQASQQHMDTFLELARNVQLTPVADARTSYIEVCTDRVCVRIDTAWEWQHGSGSAHKDAVDGSDDATPLAVFYHASTTKRERIALYASDAAPPPRGTVRDTRSVAGGVTVTSRLVDGAREVKVCTYGDYTLIVQPLQKAVSYIPDAMLAEVLTSVTARTGATSGNASGVRFVALESRYSFDMLAGSHVMASALNPNTIIYIPHGSIAELQGGDVPPEQRGPLVTVRVGTPEDEPDCMSTLEEWRTRIVSDKSLGSVSELHETTLKGERCLTFLSTAMQEVGPSTQLMMKEAVYIFCSDGVSTVIRWEVVSGQWRKYERHLRAFLDSFTFAERSAA